MLRPPSFCTLHSAFCILRSLPLSGFVRHEIAKPRVNPVPNPQYFILPPHAVRVHSALRTLHSAFCTLKPQRGATATAQGNALGTGTTKIQSALKGRPIIHNAIMIRPFRAGGKDGGHVTQGVALGWYEFAPSGLAPVLLF